MNILKLSGLAAIAGLLLIAAPTDRAQAAPMSSAGMATTVQRDVIPDVSEVQYRRHHHGYRHHHRYRHHHGYRRRLHRPHRHYGPRHHYRRHGGDRHCANLNALFSKQARLSGLFSFRPVATRAVALTWGRLSAEEDDAMRPWIGAAILAGMLGAISPAAAQTSAASMPPDDQAGSATPITEFSARHRGRAHAHRQMRRYPHRHHHWGSRVTTRRATTRDPYYYRPVRHRPVLPVRLRGLRLPALLVSAAAHSWRVHLAPPSLRAGAT